MIQEAWPLQAGMCPVMQNGLILTNCLGGKTVAGGKMKDVSDLWQSPNTGATIAAASQASGRHQLQGGYNYMGQ